MKRLTTFVFALLLGASLSFAQAAGGAPASGGQGTNAGGTGTNAPADTKGKKKGGKKKGGKKQKKSSGSTSPAPK